MKKALTLCLSLMISTVMTAQNDYSKYYKNLPVQMPVAVGPTIPDNNISLKDAGGMGDGVTMNTEAFSKAISELDKKGGGHLNVPAGIYLTGLISLKDNIDLHLEKNAIIVFSPDKKDLIKVDKTTGKPEDKATPGINASKRKNISITGEGVIDGNGEWWRPVKRGKVSDDEWETYKSMGGTISQKGDIWYPYNLKHFDNVASSCEAQETMRAHLIRLTDCENVLIQGVTIQNSPKFHIVPQRCNNFIIDGVTVRCPWNAQNGDGMDIGNSKNVLIVNNTLDVGDDGICMKGGAGKGGVDAGPCENILIMDNTVYHAHGGFVIGSEFSGGMKNIVVRENRFSGTDTGLRFKSAIGRGGKTENIFINNIYMTDIKNEAIVFETTYWDNHVGATKNTVEKKAEYVPDFSDIHISDIVCRGAKTGISAHGAPGMIHDISIDNATIFYTSQAKDIDANCDIKMNNVKLVTFEK
jgi:polygalacturonase